MTPRRNVSPMSMRNALAKPGRLENEDSDDRLHKEDRRTLL